MSCHPNCKYLASQCRWSSKKKLKARPEAREAAVPEADEEDEKSKSEEEQEPAASNTPSETELKADSTSDSDETTSEE
eukprot:4020905-Amphidinium_carterae.1